MKPARAREILIKLLNGEEAGPERYDALSLACEAVGKLEPTRAEAERKALVVLELWACDLCIGPPAEALARLQAAGAPTDALFLAARSLIDTTVSRKRQLELVPPESKP